MTKLSLYLARHYLMNILMFLAVVLSIVLIFDVLEILRRLDGQEVPILKVMAMGLLKLPEVGQIILPFVVLFSAMYTFWQLNRRQELVIMRSSGLSVWQFLTPIILTGAVIGIAQVLIINPVGAALLGKYDNFEKSFLSSGDDLVASLSDGLWLRQASRNGESIIYSKRINPEDWSFGDVTIFRFDASSQFTERIDSPMARLEQGSWRFEEAVINKNRQGTETVNDYKIQTDLSPRDIQDSFASPETRSLWELPGLIAQLRTAGFDTTRLRIHLHSLLSTPLLFAAVISIAAVISLNPTTRAGGTLRMVMTGIVAGFVIFFMTNFLKALGASSQMPVMIAAWSPAVLTLIVGFGLLLNTEDG